MAEQSSTSKDLWLLDGLEVEINWRELKTLVQDPVDRAAITQLINLETLLVDE